MLVTVVQLPLQIPVHSAPVMGDHNLLINQFVKLSEEMAESILQKLEMMETLTPLLMDVLHLEPSTLDIIEQGELSLLLIHV